jgi:hypothetical protein
MNSLFRNFANSFGVGSAVVFVITMLVFFFVLGPWLLFWSIGAMSTAAGTPIIIPLTWKTWLAAIVFLSLVKGSSSSSSKS